ncbi:MAG: helix-turn-helix transcriptional regulator [Kangiellaceae bacterium]|nr:helix-turn-helix transcriptional regulator [Kangiellaceae bacterium]MCW8997714.1 helix-turn-helix transcriptional regulator [Kangiellaceae bacterium]MCW9017604.1 helix-turn-helix transcriptional regulator [Kangiellaceae bacterium]
MIVHYNEFDLTENNIYSVIEYNVNSEPAISNRYEIQVSGSKMGGGSLESIQYGSYRTKSNPENLLSARDKKFVAQFDEVILTNYANEAFSRAMAAKLLSISERQLNRKLSALRSDNFSKILRDFRLSESLKLLNSGLQVSQISDRVGFANATYFSTCFKNKYGMTVKQYEKKCLRS